MNQNFAFPILRFTREEYLELSEQTREELARSKWPFMIELRKRPASYDPPPLWEAS